MNLYAAGNRSIHLRSAVGSDVWTWCLTAGK